MDNLIEAAQQAARKSYVPYTGTQRGAALLTRSGDVYTGCDVNNSNHPNNFHAEDVAVVEAVKNNHHEFVRGAVTSAPCGTCLQMFREFYDDEFEIAYLREDDELVEATLDRLLPES